MAFCERCGAKLEEGAEYCASCGAKVEIDSVCTNQEAQEQSKNRQENDSSIGSQGKTVHKKHGLISKINTCMDKRAEKATLSPDAGIVGKLAYICTKRQKIIFWLLIAGMVMMVFGMFTGNKYVKMVQNSRHGAYPKLTIGETFDTLFDGKAEWNYDSDEECVTVSGKCSYGGKDVVMVVGISIKDGEAENYQYVKIDGEYMDFLSLGTVINDIYMYAYRQNGISTNDIDFSW